MVDVWRALVLWKYGGVYSDIDNWPNDNYNEDTIPSDVTSFFFQDRWHRPTQYYMAAAPHHPLLYNYICQSISNVLQVPNIYKPKTPKYIREALAANFTLEIEFYEFCKHRLRQQILAME